MRRSFARLLLPVLVILPLAACPFGPSDDEPDPAAPEALIGVWQYTISGDVESTIEFRSGGTWTVVDADFAGERCVSESGTWSAADGVLSVVVEDRDGAAVSPESETVDYEISGSTLTTYYADGDSETWSRADVMKSCADYPWPVYQMTAVIDGVPYDFSSTPFFVEGELEAGIPAGSLYFGGWGDIPAGGGSACVSCRVLEFQLEATTGGAIVPGTYTAMVAGGEPLFVRALYRPAYPSSDVHYFSDDGAVEPTEWIGSMEVLTATATRFEAIFEFVMWDGRAAGPPYPSVTVTDGYVLFTYE